MNNISKASSTNSNGLYFMLYLVPSTGPPSVSNAERPQTTSKQIRRAIDMEFDHERPVNTDRESGRIITYKSVIHFTISRSPAVRKIFNIAHQFI